MLISKDLLRSVKISRVIVTNTPRNAYNYNKEFTRCLVLDCRRVLN